MKREKNNEKENKKEYEAPEIEVNKFNNSGDPVEMFVEDVTDNEMNDNTQEFDKVTENTVVDNQNAEPSENSNGNSKKTKKSHKRLSKKQEIVIISIFTIILLIAILILSWLAYEKKQNEWSLITETVTTEYGSAYEPELSDFVEFTSKVTEDNTSLEYEFVYEKEYDENGEETGNYVSYPSVNNYSVIITHTVEYSLFGINVFTFDEEQTAVVSVVDTTAPEFLGEIATEIATYQNVEIGEDTLAEKFEVYDLSEVELEIDNSLVDYETIGEYETTVCAKDIYNNATTINVVVKVKESSISVEPSNVELTVGETQELSVKVHGLSENDTTYSSDDESVATVSDDGVITAVKKGTATITVENNGKKNTVTVTVTSISTSSDITSSSNSSTNNNSVSSNKTVTNSNNTSSNSSSSEDSTKSSTNTTNSSSSSSDTATGNSGYYCWEGGSVHMIDEGETGWCSSAEECYNKIKSIISNLSSGSYSYDIEKCACGLYTGYINTY